MGINTPISRRLLLGGTAGLSLAALAGCGGSGTPSGSGTAAAPGATAAPTTAGGAPSLSGTVTHWDTWQSQSAYIDNEVKLFQEATGLTLERTQQQTGAYEDLITLGSRSGDMPDTRFLGDGPPFNEQVANGWLRPVNDLIDEEWLRTFPPYSFVEGINMIDGKIYSAPFESNAAPWIYLFINNQVFRDAGLVDSNGDVLIPKSWDDVTNYAKTINEKSANKVYGLGFGTAAFNLFSWWWTVFCTGESPTAGFNIDYRTGKYTMSSDPLAKEFLEQMVAWRDAGLFYPSSMTIDDETARIHFLQGKFGMTVGGVWNQPGWAKDGFTDYSITTMLTKKGDDPKAFFYSSPGGRFWVMNAEPKNPDGALAWWKWLYSKDAGARYAQEFAIGLSVFPEANDPSKIKDQNFANYVAAAEGKQIPGPQPGVRNPDISKVTPDAVKPDAGDIVAGVFTDQIKDIPGALKKLEDGMNASLAKAVDAAAAAGAKVSMADYVFEGWDPSKPFAYDNIDEYPSL